LGFLGSPISVATSLYVALTNINVPQDQAREVVEALEHTMNNELATKSDIALARADIALGLSRLERHDELTKAEFAAVRSEMKAEFAAVRSEVKAECAAVRGDMKAELVAVRGDMKAEFAAVRSEMNAMETRLIIKLGGLMITLIGAVSATSNWLN
jgi:hypothetical protein